MSESTVAEQGSWGRVLAEIPVNVSNSPSTSAAGRKNHEKFGRHSETNTGANSQKGKRKTPTAEFENTFQPGAETSTSKPGMASSPCQIASIMLDNVRKEVKREKLLWLSSSITEV